MIIQHSKTRMTPRERVTTALLRGVPDRVPIDYSSNPAVHARLAKALGFLPGENEQVLQALGVDFRGVHPRYIGSKLFEVPEPFRVDPVYGFVMRYVANDDGGYWDFCNFPLKGADPEAIDAFPVPSPDDFDYDTAIRHLQSIDRQGYAAHIGGAGNADVINSTGRVMGMEDALVNLMTNDEATLRYVDRYVEMEIGILERLLERAAEHIAFVWIGEDLGTQISPMISMEMYRDVLKPRHQRYIDLAKGYQKPVMVHTCGSSSWVYDEFIRMGVSAVDTLQPEAKDMSPEYLKRRFGEKLAFHGCISTAGPLAYGTEADTQRCVRETLEQMMPGGGYMLAPTHSIQDNTPVENIIAMYNAAHKYGVY